MPKTITCKRCGRETFSEEDKQFIKEYGHCLMCDHIDGESQEQYESIT